MADEKQTEKTEKPAKPAEPQKPKAEEAAPPAAPPDPAALDHTILNYAILAGALELMPESMDLTSLFIWNWPVPLTTVSDA